MIMINYTAFSPKSTAMGDKTELFPKQTALS